MSDHFASPLKVPPPPKKKKIPSGQQQPHFLNSSQLPVCLKMTLPAAMSAWVTFHACTPVLGLTARKPQVGASPAPAPAPLPGDMEKLIFSSGLSASTAAATREGGREGRGCVRACTGWRHTRTHTHTQYTVHSPTNATQPMSLACGFSESGCANARTGAKNSGGGGEKKTLRRTITSSVTAGGCAPLVTPGLVG